MSERLREYVLSMKLRVGLECEKWIMYSNDTTWLNMVRAFADTYSANRDLPRVNVRTPLMESRLKPSGGDVLVCHFFSFSFFVVFFIMGCNKEICMNYEKNVYTNMLQVKIQL